ncbi:MAG: 4Fe-4S dicluster domain-containing protein [Candidatus Korarchaeota archaeon NZ13-K]|nr:MAG: 4Fe-4S dicluster domain-containing protein [Candidatus Korarchaeota archaeon NZ13-K]
MAPLTMERPLVVTEDLSKEFLRLGGDGIKKCYQCGTCTAICPNSEIQTVRVRKLIKKIQLGMRHSVLGDPTPWTCYFCGDCNATCPKEATPGYIMDSARKYQVIHYSPFKIGKIFYERFSASIVSVVMILVGILGIFLWSDGLSRLDLTRVDINTLISSEVIHEIGLWLLAYVILVSLINILTMYRYARATMGYGKSARLSAWIRELIDVVLKEGLFQLRLRCQKGLNNRYLAHLSIFWGFVLTFAATGVHFMWLTLYPGAPEPFIVTNTARILGIAGGLLLMYGSIYYIIHRSRKDAVYAERTYLPDWWLLSLIFVIGLSGFLITTAIYANIPMMAYTSYGVHLVAVFILIVSAPFSKLAHLIYRPLALWFAKVWEGGV